MLDRNCLTWTNLSDLSLFTKFVNVLVLWIILYIVEIPHPRSQRRLNIVLIRGGWWVVGVPSVYTADLSSPPHVPASSVGPLGPRGGGNMSLIFWWGGGTSVHDRRFFGFFYLVGGKCLWCSGKCCLYSSTNHNPSPTPAKWDGLHF